MLGFFCVLHPLPKGAHDELGFLANIFDEGQ